MRIGLVTDCYHPTPNGVSVMVGLLVAGLRERGHHLVLVAPRHPGTTRADGPAADVERWSLPLLPSAGVRLAPASARAIERLVRRQRLDLVHTHTEGPLGWAARTAAAAAGVPSVHTLHTLYDHYLHYLPGRAAPQLRTRTVRRALAWFLRPYDRVVAASPAVLAEAAELAPQVPRSLVPNGVAAHADADPVEPLDWVPAGPFLLTVGRLAPEKRSQQLVEALALELVAERGVSAVLVGGGSLLRALRRRVAADGLAARIALPGVLAQRDVLALHRRAAVYLTASVSENHSLALLEAAAAGVPLAVRRVANLAAVGADASAGVVADSDRELVTAAVALTRDPVRRVRLGAGARAMAARYSDGEYVRRIEQLYAEVVAGGTASSAVLSVSAASS